MNLIIHFNLELETNCAEFAQKAYELILQNIENPNFSVEKLCAELGTSKSNLHRNLQKDLNCSAKQLINSLRLGIALILLKKQNLSLGEVAIKVGLDTENFARVFKKSTGFTPSEFRKKVENPNLGDFAGFLGENVGS